MMITNKREKTLAVVLGLTVLGTIAFSLLDSQVLQPLDAASAQTSAAARRNTKLQADFVAVEHAQRNLSDVVKQSLPEDPSVASVMYQEWLLERSNEAGFGSPLIIPGSPIPVDDVGYRIPFTVQTTAGLRQIGKFLDSFHRTDLLHRISHASISAESRSSSQRRMNITIEALALDGAGAPASLPRPGPRRVGEQPLGVLFASNDPFRRAVVRQISSPVLTVSPSDKKETESSEKPAVAEEPEIRFVAAVAQGENSQAWLVNELTGEGFVKIAGEEMRLENKTVSIIEVTPDSISFTDDNDVRTVNLGHRLNPQSEAG